MPRRPLLTTVGIAGTVAGMLLSSATATARPTGPFLPAQEATLHGQVGPQRVPKSEPAAGGLQQVSPYLGLVANPAQVNWAYWQKQLKRTGQRRVAHLARRKIAGVGEGSAQAAAPIFFDETEPDQTLGGNDRVGSAQLLPRFGLATGRVPSARVLGTLADGPSATVLSPAPEDDGSISKARNVRLSGSQSRTKTTARIGDGPHGSDGDSKGDFDFYKVTAKAGQRLVVDLDTPPTSDLTTPKLDSVLTFYDAHGKKIALNDDDGETLDSKLTISIPSDGDYYVCIGSFESVSPRDPYDSGSGPGVGSEGPYTVTFGLDSDDVDYYRFDLRPGDVLGASVRGGAHQLEVRDAEGHLRIGSKGDQSGAYPTTSPLPGGGNAVLALVTGEAGPHTIAVSSGTGAYDLTLQLFRPGPENAGASSVQTIFLDFDGAQVNTKAFGGSGVRTLSPLRAFLGRWGLRADQENAVINGVVATVRENFEHDFGDGVAVRILNSRDNKDPFGQPNVSRVIIGGTSEEAGLSTVGISQSVDPGNFATEETAIVLLDDMSAPGGSRNTSNPSLNAYFGPRSDRVAFVGRAVGTAATHEAGHYLGSWHTAAFDETPSVMDQGGNFAELWGVGPDRLGGTADDVDVDFGTDTFNAAEGFTGKQDTAAATRWGLSARR